MFLSLSASLKNKNKLNFQTKKKLQLWQRCASNRHIAIFGFECRNQSKKNLP